MRGVRRGEEGTVKRIACTWRACPEPLRRCSPRRITTTGAMTTRPGARRSRSRSRSRAPPSAHSGQVHSRHPWRSPFGRLRRAAAVLPICPRKRGKRQHEFQIAATTAVPSPAKRGKVGRQTRKGAAFDLDLEASKQDQGRPLPPLRGSFPRCAGGATARVSAVAPTSVRVRASVARRRAGGRPDPPAGRDRLRSSGTRGGLRHRERCARRRRGSRSSIG